MKKTGVPHMAPKPGGKIMSNTTQFYINGAWVDPIAGTPFDVIDPSTEEVCATISLGGEADTNAAVAAARAAFPAWAATPVADRIAALERLATAYAARAEDMSQAISQEMGAPIDMARQQQTPSGDWHFDGMLKAARAFTWETDRGVDAPGERIIYEPIGVCALITPWNWPMNQVVLKVAPALVAGCTMVLKPSEIAPLSSHVFAEIVDAADIPAGVFNLVDGDGAGVGSQLSAHPDVDMVSFTGSTRAGRLITKAGAETIKRVSLELGGKGANLIFADAHEKAVKRGALKVFNNSGQSCNAPTRMVVEASRYDQAVTEAGQRRTPWRWLPPTSRGGISVPWCRSSNTTRSRTSSNRASTRARGWCLAGRAVPTGSTAAISSAPLFLPMSRPRCGFTAKRSSGP